MATTQNNNNNNNNNNKKKDGNNNSFGVVVFVWLLLMSFLPLFNGTPGPCGRERDRAGPPFRSVIYLLDIISKFL
jgi:hypothetical protein